MKEIFKCAHIDLLRLLPTAGHEALQHIPFVVWTKAATVSPTFNDCDLSSFKL